MSDGDKDQPRPGRKAVWIGWLGCWVLRLLSWTWRVRLIGRPEVQPRIYALLHGHLLLPVVRMRRSRSVVMSSRHRDGEMMAQAVGRLGFTTVRGSSTRGGAGATRELIRSYADRPWVLTPDGPRGPRGTVKESLIRLAQMSGRTIQPMAGAARPAKALSSWDRFLVPLPFAKVVICFGEPLVIPADLPPDQRGEWVRRVEEGLRTCEEDAQAALAGW